MSRGRSRRRRNKRRVGVRTGAGPGAGCMPRSLGHTASEQDLGQHMTDLSADGQDTLEFTDFLKLLGKLVKEKEGDDELRKAFEVFLLLLLLLLFL